jgi:hypothetical protein
MEAGEYRIILFARICVRTDKVETGKIQSFIDKADRLEGMLLPFLLRRVFDEEVVYRLAR